MNSRISSIAIFAAFLSFALVTATAARPARCVITTADGVYKGRCDFSAEENGSFGISPLGREYFFGGINPISVYKTSAEIAEVRGLTKAGNNSRWGEAKRSKTDRACWQGTDFKICVY